MPPALEAQSLKKGEAPLTKLLVAIFSQYRQVFMLFTLNVYSAICQLYLNKTEGEKMS